QRHMQEFGTRPEDLGEIAVACPTHGLNNPNAQLRVPLTIDGYMGSRHVIDPLRRLDIALVSAGPVAIVITSERRARELGVPAPVPILGFGQAPTSWDVAQRPTL